MEERNLIRKQAFDVFFIRFPVVIIMMLICFALTLTINFIAKTIASSLSNQYINIILSIIQTLITLQLMYGYNKTLIRINSDEEVRDLFRFIKDAKSRIKSPILCLIIIALVASLYMLVTLFIGSLVISLISTMGNNPAITRTLSIFTAFVSIFITIYKIIPYEFAFIILAKDEEKKISALQALKDSKKILKNHVFEYILLLLPILLVFLLVVMLLGAINVYVYEIFSNSVVYYAIPALLLVILTPVVRLIEINYYDYLTSDNNK